MNRRFSSNTSINLIQLDEELDCFHKLKSNSLVEMFDPIFDKQFQDSVDQIDNCIDKSTSSEDIFAPSSKIKSFDNIPNKAETSDDELFQDFKATENQQYESIYPSLSSFKRSYSLERYSVFEKSSENPELQVSYDLRPSIFNESSITNTHCNLFNDGYANRDMDRFMRNVTELQMQSLNLLTNEKSHLVFDLTSTTTFVANEYQSNTIRVTVDMSDSINAASPIEPYSSDVNIFMVTERELVTSSIKDHFDNSMLYLRISGRGEYLRQGEFPLIQNRSVFHCYRTETSLKLILEKVDFTLDKYKLRDNISVDTSSSVYEMLDKYFYHIPRNHIENGFITLNSYRNSIVSMLREYGSERLDLCSIEASMEVLKDKCKSLCLICHNIYTADVAQQMTELENLVDLMNIAYSAKIKEVLSQCVENLIKGLDNTTKLMIQMINEVSIFCNSSFSVRSEKLCLAGLLTSPSGMQTISKCRKQFSVKLGSICSFNKMASYRSFYIKLSVKVGWQMLSDFLNCKMSCIIDNKISDEKDPISLHPRFAECIPFNETILFENLNMSCFPMETTLFIQIYGHRISSTDNQIMPQELLGWTELPLFDSSGMLQQGNILLGIWPNSIKSKVSHGSNRLKSAAVLKIELPDFHVPVKYSVDSTPNLGEMPYLKPTNTELKTIEEMVNMMWLNNNQASAKKCCNFLWKHRGYLMNTPKQYIALCLSLVSSWPDEIDSDNKDFLLNYIERCYKNVHDVTITEILHLLGPYMPLIKIRRWAVQTLREIGPDGCVSIIPWMIEALKYDSNINSSELENLLLYFSLININFSTNLFWQLSSVNFDDIHGYKVLLLLGMLRSLVNVAILEMWNMQLLVVENLQTAATNVKNTKNPSERKTVLQLKLEELYDIIKNRSYDKNIEELDHPLCEFRIPYHPGLVLTLLEIKDCSYFNSATLPLRIIFKGLDNSLVEVMFKSGDDLRQDILVLELFKLFDDIWTSEGLDLRMVHYRVMSSGHRCGLVELVTDCTTLRKIQETKGIAAPLTSVNGISEWLKYQNTTKAAYHQSVNNFLLTCAACCVSTYLLGIGDRHNDNIMIQTTGCVFHIDFAKILGDAQTFAGIKRDRVPFVLTQDMVHVLEDYQPVGDDRRNGMQLLIDKCCEAYNIIRRHWYSLQAILTIAAEANIPGVTNKTIEYVVKMLRLECSDIQASEQFTDLIRKSVNSISTPMNFVIHNLAQMKYFTNDEGSLFSFTPKIHKNGLRILSISVKSVKKIRTPNKYYTYEIWVYKETLNKPEIVFRRYEHFLELGQQLATLFPLSILPRQYQLIAQCGPPNGIDAAESRRTILQQFVSEVLELEAEISQCDLMQTFFHSTLSDEQLTDENSFVFVTETICRDYPEIQIKFSTANKSKLEIFVKHARNLTSRLNEPPNPYVKTYLLPGYTAKRKTNVIMRNSCPSFNDIITYNNIHIRPDTKVEISVWHKEVLGENFCIGSVILPVSKTMSNKEKWYRLKSRQNSEYGGSFSRQKTLPIDRLSNSVGLTSSCPLNFSDPREGRLV